MNNKISKEILDLIEAVKLLPEEHRQALDPFLIQVVSEERRRHHILSLIQDALLQLRLDMKYLMFDVEATRRERDALRDKI